MIGMLRDTWWWPWWVSSLIDLVIVLAALVVLHLSRRRTMRAVATTLAVLGLIAAVLAPVVMTGESDRPMRDGPAMRNEP